MNNIPKMKIGIVAVSVVSAGVSVLETTGSSGGSVGSVDSVSDADAPVSASAALLSGKL